MCIRDSGDLEQPVVLRDPLPTRRRAGLDLPAAGRHDQVRDCLLYTSDAADERSSVDLGGRRIIKKKKPRSSLQTPTRPLTKGVPHHMSL